MIKQENHKELLSLYDEVKRWHNVYNSLSHSVVSYNVDEEKNQQQIKSLQEIGEQTSKIWEKIIPIVEDNKVVKEWLNSCGRIDIEVLKQVVMSTLYDVKVIGLYTEGKQQIKVRCNGEEDMWHLFRDDDDSRYIIDKDEKIKVN